MSHSPGQSRVLVLVAVAALVAVVAVVIVVALPSRTSPRTVVVGDSITYLAAHDISTALKAGHYHPSIKARIGQRIDQMLPVLDEVLRSDPHAVVVNLGANDMLQGATHRDWQSGFRRMIAMLDGQPCVELTTISTIPPAHGGTPAVASEINRAIAAAVSSHKNFHVIDWNAALHGPNGIKLLETDHVHPLPPGRAVLARLTRAALDRDCKET